MLFSLLYLFILLGTSYAAIGDVCRARQGSGTCKQENGCTTGFTAVGACPNDPTDVKCCIQASCNSGSVKGACLDKSKLPCIGGNFKAENLCPGPNNVQCCLPGPGAPGGPPGPPSTPLPPKNPTTDYVAYIRRIYDLAKQYGGNRPANQLVLEWLRHVDYNDLEWRTLIGDIDDGFIKHVEAAGVTMLDTYPDPEFPGLNVKISHWGACTNGVLLKGKSPGLETNRADVAGWGGDWMTFYGEWRRDSDGTPSGGDYARAHMVNLQDDTTFKMRDLVEDADCFNIGVRLRDNPSLSIADEVATTVESGYKTRMQRFVNGRFAGNAQAIAKNMLLPGDDVVINVGRIRLVQQQGGFFVKLPLWLSDEDMDDLTKGFKDRLDAVVVEEAQKFP
ncbi:MAG: hypothetical protein LQ351_005005 [Letrouitia transgressa]|nr:MAG: hypothetical protein LQ351_005005 [Letrouitia transgressa]